MSTSPTPRELLASAEHLVAEADEETRGLWSRAAAILARHALELALHDELRKAAPGVQAAPFTTQLAVYRVVARDAAVAAEVAYVWSALSRATHHQGYELPPTAASLRGWFGVVGELVEVRDG